MKRRRLALAIGLVLGSQSAFTAATAEERPARMEAMMIEMQKRIEAQEATIQRQQSTIAEQKAFTDGSPKRMKKLADDLEKKRVAETGGDAWYRNIEIGAVVEVEAGYHSPYQGDSESDIVLATFELGISSQISDWVEVGGSLLFEEDDTPLEVDVAYATIADPGQSPRFLTVGRIYLPFGVYETHLVSDPLTLEIGETRETTAQLGFVTGGFNGSAYLFNGTNKKDGENRIGSWGANLGYAHESDSLTWVAGIGYISDLGDSDTLQDVIGDNLGGNDIGDRTGGWTVAAGIEIGPFNLIGEYLSATDSFDAVAVPWRTDGAQPKAWNLEAGYRFDMPGKGTTIAVAYQGTGQALALDLPAERWMVGLSVDILENTALSFEWAHDKDYAVSDGGTGESADTVTAQLALEF